MTAFISSKNPRTGELLAEIPQTPLEDLKKFFDRARVAQVRWESLPPKRRADHLIQLRETVLNHRDEIIEILYLETGKPKQEALMTDILPGIEALTYFAAAIPRTLRDQEYRLRLMRHRKITQSFWPIGVVAILSPWNFPFSIPLRQIAIALMTGNSVIFKPSEITPQTGLLIQKLFDESAFPAGLVQTVIGDRAFGEEIINAGPNKVFFTGSRNSGRKIAETCVKKLIRHQLDFGGNDAMIVLADADLEYATSAAIWGGLYNGGQSGGSVERILVHDSIALKFAEMLKEKISKLRTFRDSPDEYEIGPVAKKDQFAVYETQLSEAAARGIKPFTGGDLDRTQNMARPTIFFGDNLDSLALYREETFGPIITVVPFHTVSSAIEKANGVAVASSASVFARNLSLAREVARQLVARKITINDVSLSSGLAEADWGGVDRRRNAGPTISPEFLNFLNVRYVHAPRAGWMTFKHLWWFPYTQRQVVLFSHFVETYRRGILDRLHAYAAFLWYFVDFLKNDRRS